jgi:biopolymer transport protein ExbB/TolQ
MTMTNHVARLYAVSLALAVLFLTWAVVAARPWATAAAAEKDPRLVALERREARLRKQSVRVERQVERRFARYERRLAERQREIAAIQASNADAAAAAAPAAATSASAPSVGVVSLPPVTSSSSS